MFIINSMHDLGCFLFDSRIWTVKTPSPFERVFERNSNAGILPHAVRTRYQTQYERELSALIPFERVPERNTNVNSRPQFRSNASPNAARTRTAMHPFERVYERDTNAEQSVSYDLSMPPMPCKFICFLHFNMQCLCDEWLFMLPFDS